MSVPPKPLSTAPSPECPPEGQPPRVQHDIYWARSIPFTRFRYLSAVPLTAAEPGWVAGCRTCRWVGPLREKWWEAKYDGKVHIREGAGRTGEESP